MAQRLAALLDDSLLAKRRGDGYFNTTLFVERVEVGNSYLTTTLLAERERGTAT